MTIRQHLRRAGLRQHELAAALGISESWLSRAVHGRATLYPEQISRAAEVLKVSEKEVERLFVKRAA